MPRLALLTALALTLAACAGSPPAYDDDNDPGPVQGPLGGLTTDQVRQLEQLGAPVLVPRRMDGFMVDRFQASRTEYGAGYSIAYRRSGGSCFEVNGTTDGIGGPGYPIVQMDVTIGALGQPSRIYKASDDPDATSAQNWGAGTVISEFVDVDGMFVSFLSASVGGCRPLSLEEAGPIFASLAPVATGSANSTSGSSATTWADATDVLDVIGGVAGEDPETAAFAAFSTEDEGTQVTVETLNQSGTTATVLVTMLGLADDSVRDERFRIEYAEGEQGYWRAVAAQRQTRCWPGRGHQNWAPGLCQ
ncbi:MAG: hypothetical protein Rubg2KO_29800 [Rubricoccaceae bacterium]